MKKVRLKIVIVLLSLFCCLLTLEICSRVIIKKIDLPHAPVAQGVANLDVSEYPDFYMKDKDLFWRLEKSTGDINSLGFRDREFAIKKDPGTVRIICMGDSITFGWPALVEKTYSRMLEKTLNRKMPQKTIEVINAGVPGYTSYQGMVWFKKELIKYSPDAIIVYFGVNDNVPARLEDKSHKMAPALILKSVNFMKRFHAYRLYKKAIMHLYYLGKGKDVEYNTLRVVPKDFESNLAEISVAAQKINCKVVFIDNAVFYDPETGHILNKDMYRVPPGSNRIDIYEMMKRVNVDYAQLFVDDCRPHNFHLTAQGQAILAKKIAEFLIQNKILQE